MGKLDASIHRVEVTKRAIGGMLAANSAFVRQTRILGRIDRVLAGDLLCAETAREYPEAILSDGRARWLALAVWYRHSQTRRPRDLLPNGAIV